MALKNNHEGEILESLEVLRTGEWADVLIECADGVTLSAHRSILCTRSKYFSQLCTPRRHEQVIKLNVDEGSTVVDSVLDFLYTGTYEHCTKAQDTSSSDSKDATPTSSESGEDEGGETKAVSCGSRAGILLHIDIQHAAQRYGILSLEELAIKKFYDEIDHTETTSKNLYDVLEKLYKLPITNKVAAMRLDTLKEISKRFPEFHCGLFGGFRTRFTNNSELLMDMIVVLAKKNLKAMNINEKDMAPAPKASPAVSNWEPTMVPKWQPPPSNSAKGFGYTPHKPELGPIKPAPFGTFSSPPVSGSIGHFRSLSASTASSKKSEAPNTTPINSKKPPITVHNLQEALSSTASLCPMPDCRYPLSFYAEAPSDYNGSRCHIEAKCWNKKSHGADGFIVFKNLPME